MCGIAGYVGNFDKEVLKNMTDKIAHRGPDGEGQWVEKGVGLGHRRLSILDLSEAAAQPMKSVDGRYMITFNGEIYNFKELAVDLKSKGYQFNENSDTAILAPLYDAYGEGMLKMLDGIFAFAIWDKKERSLFAARDHLGMKPFYYAQTEKGFLFASELKSLLEVDTIKREVDHEAVLSYVRYLWCPGEHTMLKGVKKLLPGHFITVSEDCFCLMTRWYNVPVHKGHQEHTSEELLHLLDEVVKSQMVSDVPVGAFLSGGVDSSAIVTSMRHASDAEIETFCIGFDSEDMLKEGFSSDKDYAIAVATAADVKLNHVTAKEDFVHDLASMVYHLDEPQADPAPLYVKRICEEAKKKGIKVLLSGTGGDDIFSGYRRHQVTAMLDKYSFIPPAVQHAGLALASTFLPNGALKRRLKKLQGILGQKNDKRLLHAFYYTTPSMLLPLLNEDLKQAYHNQTADYLEHVLNHSFGTYNLNKQLNLELHGFLPDHNLNYTDKMSMAAGVEVRTPFTSQKMVDFAFELPEDQKVYKGEAKWLLKEALCERLDESIVFREKAGFGAPVRSWLLKEEAFVRDIVLSQKAMKRNLFNAAAVHKLIENTKKGRVDGAYTLLSLLVIELWLLQFYDNKTATRINIK